MSNNHGIGSNHNDGSDRQIIRAVAESCGWELEQISDERDVFVRSEPADGALPMIEIELGVDYRPEMFRGGLGGQDIYSRQVVAGGVVEGLEDVLDSLRQPLRDAWADRIEAAHAAAERGL